MGDVEKNFNEKSIRAKQHCNCWIPTKILNKN